jgi:hypothetical protein
MKKLQEHLMKNYQRVVHHHRMRIRCVPFAFLLFSIFQ